MSLDYFLPSFAVGFREELLSALVTIKPQPNRDACFQKHSLPIAETAKVRTSSKPRNCPEKCNIPATKQSKTAEMKQYCLCP